MKKNKKDICIQTPGDNYPQGSVRSHPPGSGHRHFSATQPPRGRLAAGFQALPACSTTRSHGFCHGGPFLEMPTPPSDSGRLDGPPLPHRHAHVPRPIRPPSTRTQSVDSRGAQPPPPALAPPGLSAGGRVSPRPTPTAQVPESVQSSEIQKSASSRGRCPRAPIRRHWAKGRGSHEGAKPMGRMAIPPPPPAPPPFGCPSGWPGIEGHHGPGGAGGTPPFTRWVLLIHDACRRASPHSRAPYHTAWDSAPGPHPDSPDLWSLPAVRRWHFGI